MTVDVGIGREGRRRCESGLSMIFSIPLKTFKRRLNDKALVR